MNHLAHGEALGPVFAETVLGIGRASAQAAAARMIELVGLRPDQFAALPRDLSDAAVVLRGGQVVEDGPTGEVLSNPKDPYTQSLVAASA